MPYRSPATPGPASSNRVNISDTPTPALTRADGVFGKRNASLAAFAGDTIVKQLDDARNEAWTLLGLDAPPPVLDRLAILLRQFASVLIERALRDTRTLPTLGC
jgi:hypothetical protein